MARDSMDLTSFVGKLLKEDDSDILREGIKALAQMIMDVEVSSKIGAAPYERAETRTAYRNPTRRVVALGSRATSRWVGGHIQPMMTTAFWTEQSKHGWEFACGTYAERGASKGPSRTSVR